VQAFFQERIGTTRTHVAEDIFRLEALVEALDVFTAEELAVLPIILPTGTEDIVGATAREIQAARQVRASARIPEPLEIGLALKLTATLDEIIRAHTKEPLSSVGEHGELLGIGVQVQLVRLRRQLGVFAPPKFPGPDTVFVFPALPDDSPRLAAPPAQEWISDPSLVESVDKIGPS
jgi:hypothetical protein